MIILFSLLSQEVTGGKHRGKSYSGKYYSGKSYRGKWWRRGVG
jgi:hypothetical protein